MPLVRQAYINGICKVELVPTLLSNRLQTYTMMNDWEHSLADLAASLIMHPNNKKSWVRYTEKHLKLLMIELMDSPLGRKINADHKKCSLCME
jgi:hypothetical protein